MAENLAITAEILDGVERRTGYLLAGLEVPDDGTIYEFNSQTGTSEVLSETPELPSGRALLAHLLQEGRPVNGGWVQIAKEAAIAELLLGQPTKEEGNN
jgi:hypothetical protein